MLTAKWLATCVVALIVGGSASVTSSAATQTPEDTLLAYAVHIHQTPMQTWGPGAGIYIGNGKVLTAAHVAGRTWFTRPRVVIAGMEYPTRVVKEGHLDSTDITMLAVDEKSLPMRLRMRRLDLCKAPPWPNEEVVTVIPGSVVRTRIIDPVRIPIGARKFDTAVADVAKTGNSGSGVFDLKQRCLLGIMSRKISQKRINAMTRQEETIDIAKYFVPAAEIATFLPSGTMTSR